MKQSEIIHLPSHPTNINEKLLDPKRIGRVDISDINENPVAVWQ